MATSSSNVVGVHYRVGKKIGEGSFGVIFEGTNLLTNQQVAIKFVRSAISEGTLSIALLDADRDCRSPARATHLSFEMNTAHTKSLLAAVRLDD